MMDNGEQKEEGQGVLEFGGEGSPNAGSEANSDQGPERIVVRDADLSDTPSEGFEPVMVIDPSAPPEVQARERVEAIKNGLRIVYKGSDGIDTEDAGAGAAASGAGADKGSGANEAGAEEAPHPLASLLFGEQDQSGQAVPKVTAPVREFFTKHNLGDPDVVLAELPKLRTAKVELEQKLQQASADLEHIGRLSPEALNVVQMDLEGKDWKKEVVAARPANLDYKLPFEKQDPKAMLDTYAKGKVSEDQFKEYMSEDGDPRDKAFVAQVLETASLKYGSEQNTALNYVKQQAEAYQKSQEAYTKSVDAAFSKLVSEVPGAAAREKDIRSWLTPKAVLSMFFNEDGTLRPNAPYDAWLVKERDIVLGSRMKREKIAAQNDVMVRHLNRTDEKPSNKSGRGGQAAKDNKSGTEVARELLQRMGLR